MSTRTFTPADLASWSASIVGESNVNWGGSVTAPADGQFDYSGTGGDINSDTGNPSDAPASANTNFTGTSGGNLNYSSAPAIPDSALISKITIGIEATLNVSGTGTGSGTSNATPGLHITNASSNVAFKLVANFKLGSQVTHTLTVLGSDPQSDGPNVGGVASSTSSNASDSDSSALGTTIDIDFAPPISKATLVASWSAILFQLHNENLPAQFNTFYQIAGDGDGSGAGAPVPTADGTCDGAIDCNLTDWEITVTYESDFELIQSGQLQLIGDPGGEIVPPFIIQSGELYLDGGGSEFYLIAPEISGIYVLVPNKRDDTWYDKSVTPAETFDVKIPDPFVSFAFLPEDE